MNKQNLLMTNIISNISEPKLDIIWNNIQTSDEMILEKLNILIKSPYQNKLNLINYLLNSEKYFSIKNVNDIFKFFKTISFLKNNMGSSKFNYKFIHNEAHNKLFVQNSIIKNDVSSETFIDKITLRLTNSKVKFNFFKFKAKRFYNTYDVIWVFNLKK